MPPREPLSLRATDHGVIAQEYTNGGRALLFDFDMDTYEKKYNEALERAEIAYKDTDKHIKATIERIFPELRESEDKRIGNVIYCIIRDNKEVKRILEGNGVSVDNALSYLEKQEQKLAEKQDYSRLTDLERAIHRGFLVAGVENVPVTIIKETAQECLAQMKPAWSEEDADILNCCISSIEEAKENRYAYKETDGDTSYDREIDWLQSLRPSWKPSEEQMGVYGETKTRKEGEEMSRAEEAALKAYPVHNVGDATLPYGEWDLNGVSRRGFQEGYEAAEKDILAIIQSRLSEIIGDAQPKPILRAELEELIKRIKEAKK